MPLLPPTIDPLSTASKTIYVSGILDGAIIDVHMEGIAAPIASATPGAFDVHLPIAAGVLIAGRGVWAIQKVGSDASDAPSKNEFQIVQGVPNPLGPPAFGVRPVACGMVVRVDNMFTGAEATVFDASGADGTAEEDGSIAQVALTRPVEHSVQLRASQSAGGVTSATTTADSSADPPTLPGTRKLPPPTFGQPPADCDPAVLVNDIIPGARVTITRSSGPETALCSSPSEWIFLAHALVEHEQLSLRQEVDRRCELTGVDGPTTTVAAATPVPIPVVGGPLCAGTERLTVSNLVPFGKLFLTYNGKTWETRAGRDSFKDITLAPPLATGPVTAVQERCGHKSDPSTPVPVDPAPDHIDPPYLPGPIYSCAQAVRIEQIHPGAKVRLTVIGLNGAVRISERVVYADSCDMPVSSLVQGETLFAEQFGCGIWSGKSNQPTAQAEPAVGAPRIRPDVHDFLTAVPVIDVVPGARVHVYVDGNWAGSAATGGDSLWVPISPRLAAHQKVKAWQHLCFPEGRPHFGPEVDVPSVITELRPGDTSKAKPYTIVIVANPALETPVDSGVFIPDPVMADRPGFDAAVNYTLSVLFGQLAGQAEQLLADPAIQPRLRILQIFQPDLPANDTNSLVGHLGVEIIEARRDSIAAFMADHGITADLVYALTSSTTNTRASAWPTSDDAAQGGVAFQIDGSSFTHRFFCTIPGTLAMHITAHSMTGLHEFGHAASSFTDGFVTDQYVDSPPNFNVKKGRPIPALFGSLDATNYNADSDRDGLGYPAEWTSFHPALTDPAVPSLMDNYWMAAAPHVPESCVFDTITRQFLRDRLMAKLSRP